MFLKKLLGRQYSEYRLFEKHAFVYQEIARRLLERLSVTKLQPQKILNLDCGTGYIVSMLKGQFPQSDIININFEHGSLRYSRRKQRQAKHICAKYQLLPLPEQSVELVVINLALLWNENTSQVFDEVKRVLKPGGLFVFSSLGPDTLKELSNYIKEPYSITVANNLLDMHLIGDQLLQKRFADPVMEMEMLQLNYSKLDKLITELQQLKLIDANSHAKNSDSQLQLTIEVIYGHAWQVETGSRQNVSAAGEVYISIDKIKKPGPKT